MSLYGDILAQYFINANPATKFGIDEIMQRLGKKLRTLRKQQNMTLKELALALGFTSHSFVSEIETGKKKPTTELIIKMADLFNVSVDQLVRDELDLT